MRKSYYTDQEKKEILEMKSLLGLTTEEVCAKNHISIATYYIWKRKFESKIIEEDNVQLNSADGDFKKLRQLYINLSEHNHKLAQFIKSK